MKKWIMLLLVSFVTGCVTPVVKESTPRFVLMGKVNKRNISEALVLAESECQKHGLHAVYKQDERPDGLANFECVD